MSENIVQIDVPCEVITGHYNEKPLISTVCRFKLTPSTESDWITTITNDHGHEESIGGLNIFYSDAREFFKEYEEIQRGVLIVSIEDTEEGSWRFVDNGIVLPRSSNNNYRVLTNLSDDGKKLYVTIDNVGNIGSSADNENVMSVEFLYLASCESDSGDISVHLSQDPSIGVGRIKR